MSPDEPNGPDSPHSPGGGPHTDPTTGSNPAPARNPAPERNPARRLAERIGFAPTRRDAAVRLATIAWLTLVWVLLWGSFTAANILGGLVVSIVLLALMPLPRLPVEGRFHLGSALLLAARIVVDLIRSSLELAWLALRPGPPPHSAILRTHVDIKSDLVLGLLVDAINIVPGTVVVEVDRATRNLDIHVLDADTTAKVERFYAGVATLERMFIRAFERDEDWQRRTQRPTAAVTARPATAHAGTPSNPEDEPDPATGTHEPDRPGHPGNRQDTNRQDRSPS